MLWTWIWKWIKCTVYYYNGNTSPMCKKNLNKEKFLRGVWIP
jgi:hypothetical protein